MKKLIMTFAIALVAMAGNLNAQVIIEALDVRGNGVFGHNANLGGTPQSGVTVNGVAADAASAPIESDPIEVTLTYGMLDLDADGSANDSVTFTLNVTGGTNAAEDPFQRIFNQGIDTGFGSLNDVTVTVTGVTGTTADSGSTIFFDGFTGAGCGAGTGAGNGLDRRAEINGEVVEFSTTDTGAFQFMNITVDFAEPTASVLFDNSGGVAGAGTPGVGSIVARSYDLQFSLNEPTGGGDTLGDFDGDGDVDCDDLDGYIGNIGATATGALAALDFDGDGTVSQTDANSVITTLVVAGGVTGTFPGDLNCDGTVNVLGDAFPLVANLNATATSYAEGDLNFSGNVDVLGDAFILVANLGNSNSP